MIYTMSDFHLSFSTNKPMDIFGTNWKDHAMRIKENWPLKDDDTIIMPGDLSWALKYDELVADLEFVHSLKGTKILLKGNHDMWWSSPSKLKKITETYPSIIFLHNDSIEVEGISIAGTRGWNVDGKTDDDIKIINREAVRLEISLSKIKEPNKMVFIHYPPLSPTNYDTVLTALLKKYEIIKCYYGHLHGESHNYKIDGIVDGIEYRLVSSDYLNFHPLRIK